MEGGTTGGSSGGGSASAGNTTANCPAGTIPIATTGNISATIATVTISGGGGFATCIPYTPPIQEPKKQEK